MTKIRIVLFFLSLILVFSCKKKDDDSVLGLDVQPENDLVGLTITDTASVFMFTQKVEDVKSYNDQYKYLGSNQDPIFGRTNTSIFTNISLPNSVSNIAFGDDAVLDSAELILTFTQSFVGDSTTPLLYQVHQLTQSPDRSKSYYLHNSIPYTDRFASTAA